MKRYQVSITERVVKTVYVDAKSEAEAEEKANTGEYTLKEEVDVETIRSLTEVVGCQ